MSIAEKAEELVKIKEDIASLKEKYEEKERELVQAMKDQNQSQVKITGLVIEPKYYEAKVKIHIKVDNGKKKKD